MRLFNSSTISQKRLRLILTGLILIAGIFVFLNIGYLSRNPFNHTIMIDEPIAVVENETGITAILDSAGTRVFLLSGEDRIISEITYNSRSSSTPVSADNLSIDGEYLYILDHTLAENSTAYNGDRVLVYDLNGNYKNILLDSTALEDEDHVWRIYTISADHGRVFGTFYDENAPLVLVTAEITEGKMNILHQFETMGECYDAFYSPKMDCTTSVSYNGNLEIWEGESPQNINLSTSTVQVDDVLMAQDRSIFVLDLNGKTISRYPFGEKSGNVLAKTSAKNFSLNGDTLLYADYNTYTIHRLNWKSGEEKVSDRLCFSTKMMIMGYMTWALLALGISSLVILVGSIAIKAIRQAKSEPLAEKKKENRPMTTIQLYGPLFLAMIFVFAITAFLFGRFHYEKMINEVESNLLDAAYSMREISGESFGNALKEIHSQADYGSDNYAMVDDFTNAVCMSGVDAPGSMNLSCTVYRFIEDSDNIMVVKDPTDQKRLGTIVSMEDQEAEMIDEGIRCVRDEENMYENYMTYQNGTVLYQMYAPVYDASGEVVGAVVPMMNETLAVAKIKNDIIEILLEIFSLLSVLVIIVSEGRFVKRIFAIKKKQRRHNIKKTQAESHRPISILFFMADMCLTIFCSLIAITILNHNGVENSMLIAVPVTLCCIGFGILMSLSGPVAKYHPKKYLFIAVGCQLCGVAFGVAAIMLNQFWFLVVCGFLLGCGDGLGQGTTRVIQLQGFIPLPEHRLMVFTNVERTIALALGSALGAIVRTNFGDFGLMILILTMVVINGMLIWTLIENDIGVKRSAEDVGKKQKKKSFSFLDSLSYFLRPEILFLILLCILPMGFLKGVLNYVLPLFNQSLGNTDMYIGASSLLVQWISLFMVPIILAKIEKTRVSENIWVIGGMGLISLCFLLFGLNTSLKMFVLTLIVIELCRAIFEKTGITINMTESIQAGLNPNDTNACLNVFSSIGEYVRVIVFSLMLIPGFSSFGYGWAAICGALALIGFILVQISRKKAKE